MECRFSSTGGFSPLPELAPGDLIWFKQVSGPIRAVATASSVRRVKDLNPEVVAHIRRQWGREICAPASFWRANRHAATATLIWLGEVCSFRPFTIDKRDRRAWVLLDGPPVPGQRLEMNPR